MGHIRDKPYQQMYEDDYFSIWFFNKGTGHVIFERPDLVDNMNDIIAKYYPEMLAPNKELT